MTASWIVSIVLLGQVAGSKGEAAPSTETNAPAAKAAATKPDFKATIQSTIAKKKAAQAKKARSRMAKRIKEQEEAKASREQAERMAPALAAQQLNNARAAAETQALQQMSNAMMQNAATNQMRFRLQSQQAGVPQVFIPGQGYAPYAGGIAAPYAPQVIIVP
jgi:hypothetical protein